MLGGSFERSPTDDAKLAGQVLWNIDKAIKCFMVSMWRMRTSLTGVLSVKQGQFSIKPPVRSRVYSDELERQRHKGSNPADCAHRLACIWKSPTETLPRKTRSSSNRGRPPFFVVWVGRRPGIFTTWRECQLNVLGYKGARYRGYFSLVEAQSAMRGGPPSTE